MVNHSTHTKKIVRRRGLTTLLASLGSRLVVGRVEKWSFDLGLVSTFAAGPWAGLKIEYSKIYLPCPLTFSGH